MFTTYRNPTRYDIRRDFVPPPNSYCIVNLLVLRKTWRWLTYEAETYNCILGIVAYYVVIPSDKLLCFWLHVYVNIHIIIYIVLQRNFHLQRCWPHLLKSYYWVFMQPVIVFESCWWREILYSSVLTWISGWESYRGGWSRVCGCAKQH
jgi:hypothetical protein